MDEILEKIEKLKLYSKKKQQWNIIREIEGNLKEIDENGKEVDSVIILSDQQMHRYLTVAPISELKEILPKLSVEQASALADYAIDNGLADMARADLIKPYAHKDIMKALMMKRDMEELNNKKEG